MTYNHNIKEYRLDNNIKNNLRNTLESILIGSLNKAEANDTNFVLEHRSPFDGDNPFGYRQQVFHVGDSTMVLCYSRDDDNRYVILQVHSKNEEIRKKDLKILLDEFEKNCIFEVHKKMYQDIKTEFGL